MYSVRILMCCGLLIASVLSEEKCQIAFPDKGGLFRPLVYDGAENELLLQNHEGVINVASGNTVVLSCKQHRVSDDTVHKLILNCKNGEFLNGEGETVDLADMQCQMRVLELFSVTSPKCDHLVQYKFYDKSSTEESTVAETCYDTTRDIPIYSHYKLSSPPKFLENDETTPGPFMSAVNILFTYRADELNRKITKTLGVGHARSENSLRTVSLIPKEHVHGQFSDVSRRAHNLVTLWENVMYGNFENLVKDVRKLRKNERVFDVYSGVSQAPLRLMNTKGKLVELYLQNSRTSRSFPVPEYYWAVVYEKATQKAAGFLIRNTVEGTETVPLCKNICTDLQWANNLLLNDNYLNAEIGHTVCCDMKDFRKIVDYVPVLNDVQVNGGVEGVLKE